MMEGVDHYINDLFPKAMTKFFNFMMDKRVDMNLMCEVQIPLGGGK